jgi:hypothetical protein
MLKKVAVVAVWVAGFSLALALTTSSVSAHHAFAAEFDANKHVTFDHAVVTKMEWTNPHVWIYIDAKMPDGTVQKWAIEAGTPNVLFRRGLRRDVLTPGTEIKVDGYQERDGGLRANGRDLTLPNGQNMFLGSSGTGAPPGKP